MIKLDTPWTLAPLSGKYYGTRILNASGDEVAKIWGHSDDANTDPSEREPDKDSSDCHYETQGDLDYAREIIRRVNSPEDEHAAKALLGELRDRFLDNCHLK